MGLCCIRRTPQLPSHNPINATDNITKPRPQPAIQAKLTSQPSVYSNPHGLLRSRFRPISHLRGYSRRSFRPIRTGRHRMLAFDSMLRSRLMDIEPRMPRERCVYNRPPDSPRNALHLCGPPDLSNMSTSFLPCRHWRR